MSDSYNDAAKLRQELGVIWPQLKVAEHEAFGLRRVADTLHEQRDALAAEIERLRARVAEAEALLRRASEAIIGADAGTDCPECLAAIDAFLSGPGT